MQTQEVKTNPSEESHPPELAVESSVREQLLGIVIFKGLKPCVIYPLKVGINPVF